jgi:hypothetical protein
MTQNKAATQYTDYSGSIAFDDGDFNNLRKLLSNKGIQTNSVILQFETFFHPKEASTSIDVKFDFKDGTSETIEDLTLNEFFSYFKRVNIIGNNAKVK